MSTRADARRAKEAVVDLLGDQDAVAAVGIAVTDDGYAVKVNLSEALAEEAAAAIPDTVEGVPVLVELTGPVIKQRPRL